MTSARRGEARAFFEDAFSATHDECILWPFADCSNPNYGMIQIDGRARRVNIEMCTRVQGPKPEGRWHAAHVCGHSRCINPRHLRWKTPKENEEDKRAHGTHNHVRETNPKAKLTQEQVNEIRRSHTVESSRGRPRNGSWSNTDDLALKYGVSPVTIRDIVAGRSWPPDQRE